MSYPYCYPQLIHKIFKVILKNIMPAWITSASICKYKYTISIWILIFPVIKPPIPYAITAKFTGIFTCSNIYVTYIFLYIIYSVGNDYSISKRRKIMVIYLYCILAVLSAFSIEIAYLLFFFTSMLIIGLSLFSYSALSFSIFKNWASLSSGSDIIASFCIFLYL